MNTTTKVPFYGNEIMVIEKNGRRYVAMKPIAEALGLAWKNQYEVIMNDPVLSSIILVTRIVAEDGKQREMICLPLEYLNGWLFKVPASRYTGKKREAIIRYQTECYKVLYDYFHNGGAVNSNADGSQLIGLLQKVAVLTASAISEKFGGRIMDLAEELRAKSIEVEVLKLKNELFGNFAPNSQPGEVSTHTGLPRDKFIRGYYTSNHNGKPVITLMLQLELPLEGAHA